MIPLSGTWLSAISPHTATATIPAASIAAVRTLRSRLIEIRAST